MASRPFTFPPPPPPPPRTNATSTHPQSAYSQATYGFRGQGSGLRPYSSQGQGRGGSTRGRGGGSQHFYDRGGYGAGRANFRGGHAFRGRDSQRPQHHGPDLRVLGDTCRTPSTPQPIYNTHPNSFNNAPPFNQPQTTAKPTRIFPPHANSYTAQPSSHNNDAYRNNLQPTSASYTNTKHLFPQNVSKRPHSTAFQNQPRPSPRPQAPPAVPSFGFIPLPAKPPAPFIGSHNSNSHKRKKPRISNQLGLTPQSHEYESSSDEDVDEEAKFATNGNQGLQFTHRGRTCTLKTDQEIAEWLAERRRKYPTQARREAAMKEAERKKQEWEKEKKRRAEERQAGREASRARREVANANRGRNNGRRKGANGRPDTAESAEGNSRNTSPEVSKGKLLGTTATALSPTRRKSEKSTLSANGFEVAGAEKAVLDAATKARLRAEKFRRKALKEEAKAREAEEKVLGVQRDTESTHHGIKRESRSPTVAKVSEAEFNREIKNRLRVDAEPSKSPTLSGAALLAPTSPKSSPTNAEKDASDASDDDSLSVSSSSTDPSGLDSQLDSDNTSSLRSSTTSDSEVDSDSESSSAPESRTTHRPAKPLRVPPPTRKGLPVAVVPNANDNRPLCRQFLRTGRCPRGEDCRFSHDLSQKHNGGKSGTWGRQHGKRGNVPERGRSQEQQGRRKGLYQVLVEKEQEEERRKMLEAICWLGERGMLDGDGPEEGGKGEEVMEDKGKIGVSANGMAGKPKPTMPSVKKEDRMSAGMEKTVFKTEEEHRSTKKEEQQLLPPVAADLLVAAAAAAP